MWGPLGPEAGPRWITTPRAGREPGAYGLGRCTGVACMPARDMDTQPHAHVNKSTPSRMCRFRWKMRHGMSGAATSEVSEFHPLRVGARMPVCRQGPIPPRTRGSRHASPPQGRAFLTFLNPAAQHCMFMIPCWEGCTVEEHSHAQSTTEPFCGDQIGNLSQRMPAPVQGDGLRAPAGARQEWCWAC